MQLTALIRTGRRGRSALDPALWSSIGGHLFGELAHRDRLHRVVGIEVPLLNQLGLALRYPHWSLRTVKARLMTCRPYREALTKEVARTLRPDDFAGPCFQIGAMFDGPRVLQGRAKCFSYHDGCLAERLRSPLPPVPLSAREIDHTLEFERGVYGAMDQVFTFSQYLKQSIVTNYGINADRITVAGSGINLGAVPQPVSDKRYDSKEILFVGIDFDRKGGNQLLRAFSAAREAHPSAILHIVGPQNLQIPAELARGVRCHGFLSKRVPAQKQTLEGLFRQSSLFVMPSLYEPFGIAPLEAMANEIPAVVSNGWALPELVIPGVTGELVEIGSISDLADRIKSLLSCPDRLQAMGKRAREEVVGKYRWELVVDRLLTAIDAAHRVSPC